MTVLSPENKPEGVLNTEKAQEVQPQTVALDSQEAKGAPDVQEDPNWRAFREARKRDRLEKEAAEKKAIEKEAEVAALKAAMEAAFSKSSPTPQAYQQYYGQAEASGEETEDQRLEKKLNAMLAAKEEQYKKEAAMRERQEYPNRLAREFPDFTQVCSQENLDYLDYHYPELSRPLQRLNEGYDKWHDIYHAVKKFIPNHSTAKKESLKADMNHVKPKSISSTSLTQNGDAPRQTWHEVEQRRASNWERMQRVMKGI
jgi:hypothetical protein